MPRKGRARRFREARELKHGYDDGLFREGSGTLADVAPTGEVAEDADTVEEDEDDWDDGPMLNQADEDWDPLRADEH